VVENRAGLARYLGVSRAPVTQVLSRLERAKEGAAMPDAHALDPLRAHPAFAIADMLPQFLGSGAT
jgi:hypothetical protein